MRLIPALTYISLCAVAATSASPKDASSPHPQLYLGLGHTAPVTALAWSPDGKTLATGSADHTVLLWDVTTAKPYVTLSGHTGAIRMLAWSPDSHSLASSDESHTVKLWNVATAQCRAALPRQAGA